MNANSVSRAWRRFRGERPPGGIAARVSSAFDKYGKFAFWYWVSLYSLCGAGWYAGLEFLGKEAAFDLIQQVANRLVFVLARVAAHLCRAIQSVVRSLAHLRVVARACSKQKSCASSTPSLTRPYSWLGLLTTHSHSTNLGSVVKLEISQLDSVAGKLSAVLVLNEMLEVVRVPVVLVS
jgi:hypothetical protein